MKTRITGSLTLLLILSLAFSSCSGGPSEEPEDEGSFTITIGSSSQAARTALPWDPTTQIENLVHTNRINMAGMRGSVADKTCLEFPAAGGLYKVLDTALPLTPT